MESLKKRILKDGKVKPGNVLKVDSFLNHRMDIHLLEEIGEEFRCRFETSKINKVLTIEASGIGIACMVARAFDVPLVFAKKNQTKNIAGDVFSSRVKSYTHGRIYDVIVSKEFLGPEDRVLVIDDFLANGCALDGLIEIIEQSSATLEGIGIVIEKHFQGGGERIRQKGIRVESLAMIESMTDDSLKFVE